MRFIQDYRPDVLLIQELRANPDQISFFLKSIQGYKYLFNDSGRPGYGGTAIYYKESIKPEDVTTTLDNDVLDAEGRTILIRLADLFIFNFYTPNGNSSKQRLEYKLKFYNEVTKVVTKLVGDNKLVVIGGDLNVAYTELDLFAPKTSRNSGFLPEERKWFDDLLSFGFIDTFRIFVKDGGHYTWWHLKDPKRKKNLGWRYDYFLVSKDLRYNVKKVIIKVAKTIR